MRREDHYLIIKRSDIHKYLTAMQEAQLNMLANHIARGRQRAGKPPLQAVVVESDWPEYEPVWRMIEERVDGGA